MKNLEPIAIKLLNGNFHIDGYPYATSLKKIPPTPFGSHLADLRLHQLDMIFCKNAFQKFGTLLSSTDYSLELDIYWIAILTKFYSCFKKSKARTALKKQDVFKNDMNALQAFNSLEAMRDKHIVHDENPLNTSISCVVLGDCNKIIDVFSLMMKAHHPDNGTAQNLYNLIDHTIKYVNFEIDKCIKECFKWLENLSPSVLEKMSNVETTWSGTDVYKTREY